MAVPIKPLKRAHARLVDALAQPKNEYLRDAVIQRFEFTFELAWKTLKRYFRTNDNLDLEHLKDIFREAGSQGLIDSVEDWFSYLEARNQTSHTYDEEAAEETYQVAAKFAGDAQKLVERLERLIG